MSKRDKAWTTIVLLVFEAFVFLILSSNAYAAGMTAHLAAGELVIEGIGDESLKEFLNKNKNMYMNGILVPDAVQKFMKDKKMGDSDKASHGRTTSPQNPTGYTAFYIDEYRKNCSMPLNFQPPLHLQACKDALAFYFGILTHLVTDGPWHGQFIDHTTDGKCDADINGQSHNSDRHGIADTDFDFCLSKRIKGFKGNITAAGEFARATKHESPYCPKGTFFDPRNWGECWSCPDGYNRTAYPVTDKRACVKPGYEKFKKAEKKRENTKIGEGCPKGQFWDVKGGKGLLGACYSCEGYNRTLYPVDSDKSCSKAVSETPAPAKFVEKFGCSKGQFFDPRNGGECWSCPSDYNRTIFAVTDEKACQKQKILPCDKVSIPSSIAPPTVLPLLTSTGYDYLSAAYKKDGEDFSSGDMRYAVDIFRGMLYFEDAASPFVATKYADKCEWIYSHAFDGQGGINDSAIESARFLEYIWKELKSGAPFSVVRTATYKYAVVRNGMKLYETKD